MNTKLVSLLVLYMFVGTMVPIVGLSGDAGDSPNEVPAEMLIWEAYAKGYVTVTQLQDASFRVSNIADQKVVLDEKVQLLSPHPLDVSPQPTTQDGALTEWTIQPQSAVKFNYGDPGIGQELPEPLWWCTEQYQATQASVQVRLGGEIIPYDLETILLLPRDKRQQTLWDYQQDHPTVVIGKTPLWKEIPDNQENEINIKLAITNTGFEGADDVLVIDSILPGYSYDPNSFSLQPTSIEVDLAGNTIFKWFIELDAAQWTDPMLQDPTDYDTDIITYTIKTPMLAEGRHFLPRAFVDHNNDVNNDAESAKPLLEVYHVNQPPVADAGGFYYSQEGSILTLDAGNSYDPDGDPIQFRWDLESDGVWDTGWLNSSTLDLTLGDDVSGMVKLEVTDGDESSVAFAYYLVENVAPSISLTSISSLSVGNEGDTFAFEIEVTDPGSDDLTLEWFGDCQGWSGPIFSPNDPLIVPDPDPSPDTNPRDITDSQAVTCGDDGYFSWGVVVEDDDLGVTELEGSFQVSNLLPTLTMAPPSTVQGHESLTVTLSAEASDLGSDDLTFTWDWDYGPTETRIYFNDGLAPDPPGSPEGTFPFSAADSSTHTYGDDCLCNVTLTVEDDDGGVLTYTTNVEVGNLPPELVGEVKAYAVGDLTLRIAGEKWHDVELVIYNSGAEVAVASIMRMPGSPDRQSVTLNEVMIDLFEGDLYAVVRYTPLDDAINGQWLGADPAWLIFTPHGGRQEVRLHHTFNVRHSETWIWTISSFNAFLIGANINFEATASDAGSDDLTFEWNLGDGTSEQHLYCNSAICPDPYPSPEVNPIQVKDITGHSYHEAGIYTIILTVSDDDGDEITFTHDIRIG
jgi:hypothetical protein